jgi:tetratricopeptide (TPR) repeat protein
MQRRRKVWQHDVQKVSEDQLREFLHSLGWEVDPIGDYGEDFLVRIFREGNPTGQGFYVQLKGTKSVEQYALKRSDVFSYGVEVVNLWQWRRFPPPVVFVLWDIEQRTGYWLHLQPFIEKTLEAKPQWLDAPDDSKRQIHIPFAQVLCDGDAESLQKTIDNEYQIIELAKQHLERLQEEALDDIGRALETSQEAVILPRLSTPLPPKVQQQILIAQYQAAITANPSDSQAWLGQAEVYYELNEMDKAMVAINRAWEWNCQDLRAVWCKACILAEYAIAKGGPRSMLHEAIDLFESCRDKAFTASVDYSIGNCLAGLEDHHKAVEHFDRALAASPSPELAAQIWKNRGTSFFHLGNHEEEIASYKKALELNPNLWEAYSSWAATELHRDHFEHAKTLFMKAFQANPELEVGGYPQLYSLAYTLWQLGDLVEAYRRVNEVLALKPDHQDGLLLKTHLLSQLWRMDAFYVSDALAFFKRRVLDNREDMFARSELYLIYKSEGDQGHARSILEETVSLGNAPPRALYHYAVLHEKEGKIHEAIHYLEMAFEESQEHHIVHALGRLKQKVGDYRGAIDFYNLALRDVTDVPILRSIADCYHFLGEYKDCVRLSVRMILLEPHNEMWWTNLQYALVQLGEGELFGTFIYFLHKLRAGNHISGEDVEATMDELLSRLRVQFGDEFVLTITSPGSA